MTVDPTYGTREEHLAWCKKRALAYVEIGQLDNALASMGSDLRKHPDTANHAGMELWLLERLSGRLSTPEETRRFIEGFH